MKNNKQTEKIILAILLMIISIGLLIIVAIGIYNDNLLETITGMLNDKKPVAIGLLVGSALSAAMVIHKLMSVSGE